MRYTVNVARPVYQRTEAYGEGLGRDDAIRAAQQAAGDENAEGEQTVRGDAFIAAVRLDAKPVEVPFGYTEYAILSAAAKLAQFTQAENVLGSKVPAGCARRTYEHTIVHVESAGAEAAVRHALVRAKGTQSRWSQTPARAVAIVIDRELVRSADDNDGEMMAVPEEFAALGKLKGYDSPLAHDDTPGEHCHGARQSLRSLVALASVDPHATRKSGLSADLDELQQLMDEARLRIGDRSRLPRTATATDNSGRTDRK